MSKAKYRSPWKLALWGGLVGFVTFLLAAELLKDNPRWWLVAVRVLVVAGVGTSLYTEIRKPKADGSPQPVVDAGDGA